MKITAIGDIHGTDLWKKIIDHHFNDMVVFVGDYWDSYDLPFIQQLHNFREICRLKEQHPEKVKLLIGNHDYHYTPVAGIYAEKYSGFQKKRCMEIGYEMQLNKHLFQMAYKHDRYLFTHAGVTKAWFNCTLGLNGEDKLGVENLFPVDEYINDVYKFKPQLFVFRGMDEYGDDPTQSPIWVRPQSLNEDAMDYIHVVGHTQQQRIGTEPTKFLNGGSGLFIDTLHTSREFLILEGDTVKVEKII